MDFTFPLFWGIRGYHPFHPFADLQVLHSNAHRLDPLSLQVLQHASTDRSARLTFDVSTLCKTGETKAKSWPDCSCKGPIMFNHRSFHWIPPGWRPTLDWLVEPKKCATARWNAMLLWKAIFSGLSKGQEAKYMLSPIPSSSGSGSCSSICCLRQLAKSCKLERNFFRPYLTQLLGLHVFDPSALSSELFSLQTDNSAFRKSLGLTMIRSWVLLDASGSRSSTLWGFFNRAKNNYINLNITL